MRNIMLMVFILLLNNSVFSQDFTLKAKLSNSVNKNSYLKFGHFSFEGLFTVINDYAEIGISIGSIQVEFNEPIQLHGSQVQNSSIGIVGYFYPLKKRWSKYIDPFIGIKLSHLLDFVWFPVSLIKSNYTGFPGDNNIYSDYYLSNNFTTDFLAGIVFFPLNKFNFIFEIAYNIRFFDLEYHKNKYDHEYSYTVHNESKVISTLLWSLGVQYQF